MASLRSYGCPPGGPHYGFRHNYRVQYCVVSTVYAVYMYYIIGKARYKERVISRISRLSGAPRRAEGHRAGGKRGKRTQQPHASPNVSHRLFGAVKKESGTPAA